MRVFYTKFLLILMLCSFVSVYGGSNSNYSLCDLVASSGNNDIIFLNSSSYSGFENRDVVIDKNLTIVGNNNTTISADSAGKIFSVKTNCHLTLFNLSLTDGSSDKGGLLFCDNNTSLNIVNCSFRDSKALYGGGAVYLNHDNVDIVNSSFTDNRVDAYYGGALYSSDTNLNLVNCSFESNHGYHGGALYNAPFGSSKTVITGSNFTDNNANANGGAVYTIGGSGFTISESSFRENKIISPMVDYGKGGAIYNKGTKNFNVVNTKFTSNFAVNGAGVFNDDDGEVNVLSSNLTGNIAGGGGAIYNNKGALYITDVCNINNNTANSGYGGAIVNKGFVKITISNVDNNKCNKYGGAIYSTAGNVVIADCELNNNIGDTTGGAISATNTNIHIATTDFKNNVAGTGGGIHADNCQIVLDDSRRGGNLFENNTATLQDGGGMFLMGKTNGSIFNTIFKSDSCSGKGGAIFCGQDIKCVNKTTNSTGIVLLLDKIQYSDNSAGRGGVNVYSSRTGDMGNIGGQYKLNKNFKGVLL